LKQKVSLSRCTSALVNLLVLLVGPRKDFSEMLPARCLNAVSQTER